MNYNEFKDMVLNDFESYLKSVVSEENKLKESMNYSLLSNGKRIRPFIIFILLDAFGLDYKLGYEVALAVEMVHTYSLIHDDLPILDDDAFRRGKPTNHKVYGEDVALLSGDALLTDAFKILTGAPIDDAKKVLMINLLSQAAGSNGMVLGQYNDIKQNIQTKEDLDQVHELKTGALIEYCFRSVCVINEVDIETQTALIQIGKNIGLAFQIKDDLLDSLSTLEELGKDVNSDLENEKVTYVSLIGIEQSQVILDKLVEESKELLANLNMKQTYLNSLIEYISTRRK